VKEHSLATQNQVNLNGLTSPFFGAAKQGRLILEDNKESSINSKNFLNYNELGPFQAIEEESPRLFVAAEDRVDHLTQSLKVGSTPQKLSLGGDNLLYIHKRLSIKGDYTDDRRALDNNFFDE